MIYYEREWVRIHWDESIEAVWAEWLSYVEGADARNALDEGLELVEKRRARKWLADTRNLGAVRQEDQQWTNENWFPRVIKAGVRWMALIVPRKIVAQMALNRMMRGVDLTTAYFDDLSPAREWLKSHR